MSCDRLTEFEQAFTEDLIQKFIEINKVKYQEFVAEEWALSEQNCCEELENE